MRAFFLLFIALLCSLSHLSALINPALDEQGMATTLFTREQYCTFLNAVAKNGDPHHFYQPSHRAYIYCGTTTPPYTYSVIRDANYPITDMDLLMAARVANWMHNGQLTEDQDGEAAINSTETGAYKLQESVKLNDNIVTLLPGAKWRLPHQSDITPIMVASDDTFRVVELTDTEYLRQSQGRNPYILWRAYYLSKKPLFGGKEGLEYQYASQPMEIAGFRLVKQ